MHRRRTSLVLSLLTLSLWSLAQPSRLKSFDIRMAYSSPTAPARAFHSEPFSLGASGDSVIHVELNLKCTQRRANVEAVTATASGVRAMGAILRMTLRDAESREIVFAATYPMPVIGSRQWTETIRLNRPARTYRLVFEDRWSETVKGRSVSRGGALVDWDGSSASVLADGTTFPTILDPDTTRRRFKVD